MDATRETTVRGNGSPLWKQISKTLAGDIEQGRYHPGQFLPTEKLLSEQFAVNRHTIRRAIKDLQSHGVVLTRQGRGTVVRDRPFDYLMTRRTRFSENMHINKARSHSHFLYGDIIPAPENAALALGVKPGARIQYVEMYGEADGKKLFVSSGYFPVQGLDGLIELFARVGSLTKVFAHMGVTDFFRRESRISCRLPQADESRILQLEPEQCVLVVEYVNVTAAGKPIEFGVTRFAGDRISIFVPGHEQ